LSSDIHLSITYAFGSKIDLKTLNVFNGVGTAEDRGYDTTLRPQNVDLLFPGTNIPACPVKFPDVQGEGGAVNVEGCNANGVDRVQLRIVDYYQSAGAKVVALALVEFFKD
ncbi:MAG: hypothetical protein QOI15_2101, partial [Pseudonocardiales bacterium]|nr:hypothetical protein [Pseudonocardiales bacterium]